MAIQRKITAAGTPHTMTGTPASVVFGTTSPRVTFAPATGKKTLRARAIIDISAATLTQQREVTLGLRRTNHTPVNVPGSFTTVKLPVETNSGQGGDIVLELPPCVLNLSGTSGDVVTLWASLDALTGITGSVTIREASIAVLA